MELNRTFRFLLCCMCTAILLFPSCNNDDDPGANASEFFIEGKADGQLVHCDFVPAGLEGSIFTSFGVRIMSLTSTVEGGNERWNLMVQSTEHPDDWVLPKKFEGSIIDPFSDNVNGGFTNADGMGYGALDPILCGMDWDWELTVTSWENNVIEGRFEGNFYSGDCDPTTAEELESISVTEGRFKMEVQ
ncbi:MAG TPA: hypothetical protein ENJ95_18700 [Bacteroidetes bacterium]|nr:hypothetical protein [Bacteroidota bacterium]